MQKSERTERERDLRARIAAQPRCAELWIELARLLSASDEESDQRTAESCWQRALRLDPTVQPDRAEPAAALDATSEESVTTTEVLSYELPLSEHAASETVDGFFAESSATDQSSMDSLFQFPFACRPIVITGGEFCGTKELVKLLAGHSRIVTIEADGKSPEELHTALRNVEAGHRALIHAPAWEYRLDSLAKWPGATVVWLDRDANERIAEMTDKQLVLERFGPWGVMRPWSVHPDGGVLAFERCLKQFEATGNAIPSTLIKAWQRLQATKPFRRSIQQARWLAPEYCRILAHLWQTSSSETSIRVMTNELTKSHEAAVRRIFAFANLLVDEAHLLDNAAAEESELQTTGDVKASSPW